MDWVCASNGAAGLGMLTDHGSKLHGWMKKDYEYSHNFGRGALLYNYYVKKHDIENKHPLIQEGEKIKFMYLRTPNPLHENVVSFFGDLPKEFGLENYVDYQTQFEKSFLEPLKNVLQCIGWSHKKSVSIGSFFE